MSSIIVDFLWGNKNKSWGMRGGRRETRHTCWPQLLDLESGTCAGLGLLRLGVWERQNHMNNMGVKYPAHGEEKLTSTSFPEEKEVKSLIEELELNLSRS